ncbi:MAG: OmpA family protein, partial [Sediminibacterium sp.]
YSAILYDSPLVKRSPSLIYPFQTTNTGHTKKIKEFKRSQAQYKLAESYRLYHYYTDALPQYEQYIQSKDTKFPLAALWYGQCLLATDQPEKAITQFNTFLQKYKTADTFAQKARLGIADANFRISSRGVKPVAIVTKIKATISEDGSNFGMQKMNDGSFWFTSSRHEVDKRKEKFYPLRLYTGNSTNGNVGKIIGVAGDEMNAGASSLSVDKLTVYFTGWKEAKKSIPVYYNIYSATRSSISAPWNIPVALPFSVNIPDFNTKQPFIGRDNKYLFFVSDRPGGYGQYDIWMINLDDNGRVTGNAFNLGNAVNTDGEEASPFYDLDSSYLYYSSNGKIGIGGMDIYKIYGRPGEWGSTAINLGSPVNSVKDDLYYTREPNSDTAYLSSDRASNCCLEIFKAAHLNDKDTANNAVKNLSPSPQQTLLPPVAQQETDRQHLIDSLNAITVERIHVNYNFASSAVRKVDWPQLNHVIQLLKKDISLHVLIASFTDCIGSKNANMRLSRKRSESVKKYLNANGIDTAKVNIDFFGKKHLILACKEDSSYDTKKQLANRRSDLIVTHDPNPKWQPTGEELDLNETGVNGVKSGTTLYNNVAVASNQLNTTDKNLSNGKTNADNKAAAEKVNSTETNIFGKTTPGVKKEADTTGITEMATTTGANGSKYRNAINSAKEKRNTLADKKALTPADENKVMKNKGQAVEKIRNAVTETVTKPVMRRTIDSLQTVIKIAQLIDLKPILKNPDVIKEMTSRTPRKSFEVFTTSDSVKIELYDNGVFDNDSVSVIYNKQLTVYKQMLLTNKPIRFWVKLDPDQAKNEMIFFAENLGITPPNSALMIITDGENKRTEINVSSDLQHNAVIYFIKVKK